MSRQKKSEEKKLFIIQCGAKLINENGYSATGLKEILGAAGIPKGSFYHFFKSKDDFGLQVVDFFVKDIGEMVRGKLINPDLKPLQRIKSFFDLYIEYYENNDTRYFGCPIGNLALEMSAVNENFRRKLEGSLKEISGLIEDCLIEEIELRKLKSKSNAKLLSEFLLNSWEGAMLAVKTTHSDRPLRIFDRMIFGDFLDAQLSREE
ncbi:MAG: TetR family transcriptional regulator C-terminal domain-containing protein [SAR324 cluster bacterium]|nr:TetR family transcriptional regulator C-terminal domain-containing protein [SAR324 cluster bacterium]